jgi:hypothetical protein
VKSASVGFVQDNVIVLPTAVVLRPVTGPGAVTSRQVPVVAAVKLAAAAWLPKTSCAKTA